MPSRRPWRRRPQRRRPRITVLLGPPRPQPRPRITVLLGPLRGRSGCRLGDEELVEQTHRAGYPLPPAYCAAARPGPGRLSPLAARGRCYATPVRRPPVPSSFSSSFSSSGPDLPGAGAAGALLHAAGLRPAGPQVRPHPLPHPGAGRARGGRAARAAAAPSGTGSTSAAGRASGCACCARCARAGWSASTSARGCSPRPAGAWARGPTGRRYCWCRATPSPWGSRGPSTWSPASARSGTSRGARSGASCAGVFRAPAPGGALRLRRLSRRPCRFSPRWLLGRGYNAVAHLRNRLVRPPFVMCYLTFTLEDGAAPAGGGRLRGRGRARALPGAVPGGRAGLARRAASTSP